MSSNDSFEEVQNIIKRYVLFLGRHGVGKSNYSGCLRGKNKQGRSGLHEGTKELQHYSFLHGEYNITVFDSVGLTGVEDIDLQRFTTLQQALQDDEGGKISVIFFCTQWKRLTEVDKKAIEFVKNFCTKEMHALIHVLVTHASESWKEDRESVQELQRQFDFLLKVEGDFERRFSFVDLLPPQARFENCPEATEIVRNEWKDFRKKMLDIVETSQSACLTKKFKLTTELDDWLRLNRQKIYLYSLGFACLFIAILYMWAMQTSSQLESEKINAQKGQRAAQDQYEGLMNDYRFWINVGNAFGKVGSSIRNTFSGR